MERWFQKSFFIFGRNCHWANWAPTVGRKKNKRETQRPPSKQHESVAQRDTHEELSTKDERRGENRKKRRRTTSLFVVVAPRFVRERKKERDKIARGGWEERER